jgi:hypothetical protein
MTHEIAVWTATPILAPLPRGTIVRLASAMPYPGAAGNEAAVVVTMPGDAPWHVGDLFALVSPSVPAELVRVLGDVVIDAAGRWTATGALD